MQNNFDEFSMQDAMRLAATDTGKALIQMFKQEHADQVDTVMDSMRAGDMEKVKQALAAFMADPRTQAMLSQMEGSHGRNGR